MPLPSEPSLEHLRGQAKTLQRRFSDGDPDALALVERLHPRPPARDAFTRADAQLVVARGYGFASWPKLKGHLELVERFGRSPHRAGAAADPVDEFLRLAVLTYGADDPARPQAARALLGERPQIARASLHAAAAAGDPEAVAALLKPGAVRRQGGPHRWEPLLYLTYSRAAGDGSLAAARLLLDAGADPNAGFMWEGLVPPFTALAGALGRGEGDPPPHRDALALARLLLEAGADASDGQVIYNHSWTPGDEWLTLLIEHGLGRGDGGPWRARLGEQVASPRENLEDVLTWSAEYGMPSRIRMALAAGVDPDGRGTRHPNLHGRTALELAIRNGDEESAALLRAAGAREPSLGAAEANDAAYMRADATAVGAPPSPGLIIRAAEHGRHAAVRLLAEHGADVNHQQRRTTPEGWADHAGEEETAAYLRSLSP